jgi:hypothetical protein
VKKKQKNAGFFFMSKKCYTSNGTINRKNTKFAEKHLTELEIGPIVEL